MQEISENGGGGESRTEAGGDFTTGAGKKRKAQAHGFAVHADGRDGSGDDGFGKPDAEPGTWICPILGEPGSQRCGRAQDYQSPAGNGGEGRRTGESIANEAEVLGGFGVERAKAAGAADAVLARIRHEGMVAWPIMFVKYFVMQSLTTARSS
jgi:hypothetical protein